MADLSRQAFRSHGTSRRHLQERDEPNQAFLLFLNGGSIPSPLAGIVILWINCILSCFRAIMSMDARDNFPVDMVEQVRFFKVRGYDRRGTTQSRSVSDLLDIVLRPT